MASRNKKGMCRMKIDMLELRNKDEKMEAYSKIDEAMDLLFEASIMLGLSSFNATNKISSPTNDECTEWIEENISIRFTATESKEGAE